MSNSSIHLVIDGNDVSDYVTSYNVNGSRRSDSGAGGNTFTNWDGTLIGSDGTVYEKSYIYTVSLTASLRRVPRALAALIGDSLAKEDFSVTYDSPAHNISGTAVPVSYKADSRRFGETWDIDLSLNIQPSGSSPGGGL